MKNKSGRELPDLFISRTSFCAFCAFLWLDLFDGDACGGAFAWVADGVLEVADTVDDAIESGVCMAADVCMRLQRSNLTVQCCTQRNAFQPIDL